MTLDEKLGQLFMPVHRTVEQSRRLVERFHVGGFWFARTDARTIAAELNTLQQLSKYPLLISVDFEKGAGTYVDGATDLPVNMALGASRNPAIAYRAAALTAREARALGVHVNFAPVMDVNNNPKNPIINTRSYGEDPRLVAQLAEVAVRGYQEHGLLATGKHFPGHGNTDTDSHTRLGVVPSDAEQFENIELLPYRHTLEKTDLASIMTAHLWIKAVDNDTIPATLSPNAMQRLLRERLNFDGVIYTDAMEMGGITTRYPFEVAVVKALQAGCDVILFPGSVEKGIAAIKEAIRDGQLTEQRIRESVRRILLSKTRVGLHTNRLVDVERIPQVVGTEANYREAKEIAAACLTLVKDDAKLLPLKSTTRTAVLTIANVEGPSMVSRGLVTFPADMQRLNPAVIHQRLSPSLNADEMERALELARNADVVVIAAYVRIVLHAGTVELPPAHAEFVQRVLTVNPNVVLVSFGNPYIGASVPGVPTYVCAYDNARVLQEVAAEALFGKVGFNGKLPVTVSKEMPYGTGIVTQ
jgi:beta-N-acetylhexosaminidase